MRGFTLIEVLVALAILAVALAAATRAAGAAVTAQDELRRRLLAGWTAENRLAEHQALHDWPEVGRSEGRSGMGGETFVWTETVSSTPHARFRRVDISVAAEGAGEHELARLTGFLTAP